MSAAETFQIPLEVAEIYEAKFVPAIFAEWAPHLLDAAGVGPGCRVLDVACGTGIVARTAADRVDPDGSVTGIDLNEAMLTVARRLRPDLTWRQGDVASLPFPDGSFDAVVCQMAFMFFPDREAAFAEMGRVAAAGATVAVVVPAALDAQPAYQPFVKIAVGHAGPEAGSLLSTYWSCGDLEIMTAAMAAAGLDDVEARTRVGTARFESADDFVATEIEGSPLAGRLDQATYAAVGREVASELGHYATPQGTFEIPLVGHVIVARRP
jgi:SAM-dependent methyltransferase